MDDELIDLKMQHRETYKLAILDIINNNTETLVSEDILSLLKKPPLDSMDLIKSKFLYLAKRNKIILKTDQLSSLLEKYRNYMFKCCNLIKDIRLKGLHNKVEQTAFEKESDIIKINKKDFIDINKKIKKLIKTQLSEGLENYILKDINNIFMSQMNSDISDKMISDFVKYMKGPYQKQLLENFDIKILVKDTTLINVVKEQNERYIFTLNNSRLLNNNDRQS